MNALTKPANFAMGADFTTTTGESGQATGLISFKYAKEKWGGECCAAVGDCKLAGFGKLDGSDALMDADPKVFRCDATADEKLKLFATNHKGRISHSFTKAFAKDVDNAVMSATTSVVFNSALTMPAYLTTVRGRGGFGSSKQKLCESFFQMISSSSTATSGGV
jgi:hypothetical protein